MRWPNRGGESQQINAACCRHRLHRARTLLLFPRRQLNFPLNEWKICQIIYPAILHFCLIEREQKENEFYYFAFLLQEQKIFIKEIITNSLELTEVNPLGLYRDITTKASQGICNKAIVWG